MLSVIMLSVIMQSDVVVSVVASIQRKYASFYSYFWGYAEKSFMTKITAIIIVSRKKLSGDKHSSLFCC